MKQYKPFASREWEVEMVCREIRGLPNRKVYCEIGSFKGASLAAFGQHMDSGAKLIAVDKPMPKTNGGEDLKAVAEELRGEGFEVVLHLGDSKAPAIIASVAEDIGANLIDVLFIDGDHSAAGVRADIKNYIPMVRPGGLAIFHDIGPCRWGTAITQPTIDSVFPEWRKLGGRHHRKAIYQICNGYGLVWINTE